MLSISSDYLSTGAASLRARPSKNSSRLSTTNLALDLDNVQLFAKCYSQLTQMAVTANHPKMIAVRDQGRDPIAACMDVFDKALLKLPVATLPPSVNSETTIV